MVVAFGVEVDGLVMIIVLLLVSLASREGGMIDGQCGAPSFGFCWSTALDKEPRPSHPCVYTRDERSISSVRTATVGGRHHVSFITTYQRDTFLREDRICIYYYYF